MFREPCDENLIRAGTFETPRDHARARGVLAATILASSMAFIDGTVVNVAVPALQTGLNATVLDAQWVVEAYSLLLSAFLLVGGSLGDHYGRRRIFLLGVVIFSIASAACGLAQTIRELIILRGLQGFGAALLVPGSLAIISSSFPEEARGRAIGTWSAFSAITTGIGPLMGGWLIEHVSWRAVFFINLPIACAVFLLAWRCIGETVDRKARHVDWLGASVAAAGLGSLVYGLIESSRVDPADRTWMVFVGGAIVLLVIFVTIEAVKTEPMLPLGLFRSRIFAGSNLLTFLLYAALGGALFFLPLNLIQVQRYSPTAAGAALLPFILIMSILSRWSGGLVARIGPRLPLILGPLIASVGYLLFLRPDNNAGYWQGFFPPVAVLGIGMAVTVAPLTTTVMGSVPLDRAGVASGINNAIARTAGLLAIAVLGIVMLRMFTSELGRGLSDLHLPIAAAEAVQKQTTRLAAIAIPSGESETTQLLRAVIDRSFIAGFRMVMIVAATLAMTSAVVAFMFVRPVIPAKATGGSESSL